MFKEQSKKATVLHLLFAFLLAYNKQLNYIALHSMKMTQNSISCNCQQMVENLCYYILFILKGNRQIRNIYT